MTETEGIVLSPQRRSFITGCQVSKDTSSSSNNSNSATNSKETSSTTSGSDPSKSSSESLRPDTIAASRRVGSGRIRPSQPPPEDFDRDRGDRERGDHRDRDRDRRFDQDSRYGFRGDRERGGLRDREWGPPPARNDRLGGGRGAKMEPRGAGGRRGPRDSVPEWMDAPVNQDDMMELRGFDDSPEKEVKPKKETKLERKEDKKPKPNDEFNIDDIIHMDVIPGKICLQFPIFSFHLTRFFCENFNS